MNNLNPLYPNARVTVSESTALIKDLFSSSSFTDVDKNKILSTINALLPFNNLLDKSVYPKYEKKSEITKEFEETENENYVTFDVSKQVESIRKRFKLEGEIFLNLNVDGASIFKHGLRPSFWPMLATVENCQLDYLDSIRQENMVVVGLSHLKSKISKPSRQFVEDCMEEVEKANVTPHIFVADNPANAWIMGHKSVSHKNGCRQCWVIVNHENGVPQYPDSYFFDTNYRLKTEADYNLGNGDCFNETPLTQDVIPVTNFIYELLHGLGHGVIRRQLLLMFKPSLIVPKKYKKTIFNLPKFDQNKIDYVNSVLKSLSLPIQETICKSDINISRDYNYKAKLSFFLCLYTIPILQKYLHEEEFLSLIVLSEITYLLTFKKKLSDDEFIILKDLVDRFCKKNSLIWGDFMQSIGVHGLRHLVEQMEKNGHLTPIYYSCFVFESFNQKINKFIHGSRGTVQQFSRNFEDFYSSNKDVVPNKRNLPKFLPYNKNPKNKCNSYAFDTKNEKFIYITKCDENYLYGKKIEAETIKYFTSINYKSHMYKITKFTNNDIKLKKSDCILCIQYLKFIILYVDYVFM